MNATSLREALQRVLGLIPTLFLVSLAAFWVLSRALPAVRSEAPAQGRLPLFFNPSPVGVGQRAEALADAIASGRAGSGERAELVRLGAASLPSLMPHLDSLLPQQRAKVALALGPVALRMGIADAEEIATPEMAAAFWNRYWTDHFIDFRPRVVERAVARLIERPSALRRVELRRLDTFALPALMESLEITADPEAQRELLALAAQITGRPWEAELSPTSGLEHERQECLSWWSRESRTWSSFQGSRRLVAMLQETQYGKWVLGGVWRPLGNLADDWQLTPTLALIAAGILGGYFAGPLLAAWTATAIAGRSVALALSLILASVPAAAAADWLTLGGLNQRFLALLAMLVLGAGLLCLYQYRATRDACSYDFVQTHLAFGASPVRAALGALRSSSLVSAAHLANHGPGLFAAACVVEWAFDWRGLGWLTLRAVQQHDVASLTWIALFGVLLSGLLQIMSDLLQSRFEHRGRSA